MARVAPRRGRCSRRSRSRRRRPSSGSSTLLRGTPPTASRNAWRPACSTAEPGGVAFRHELARLAVEESLPPNAKLALHRKALAALASRSEGAPDVARLAHHAEAAGDAEAVLRFAPAAAARAASVGAHREAAAQYARALRFAEGLPPEARAELLDRRARECSVIGAVHRGDRRRTGRRSSVTDEVGDARREGDSLRALSWPLWVIGRAADAAEARPGGRGRPRAAATRARARPGLRALSSLQPWPPTTWRRRSPGARARSSSPSDLDDDRDRSSTRSRTSPRRAGWRATRRAARSSSESLELCPGGGAGGAGGGRSCYLALRRDACSCARPRRVLRRRGDRVLQRARPGVAGDRF